MVIGCLKTSLPTVCKAICMTRVLFVIRNDIKNPERALVKEIHRVANHLVEKLDPDITHHLIGHPLHAISASIGTEAANSHDRGDGEANQDDRIDFWPRIESSKIMSARPSELGAAPWKMVLVTRAIASGKKGLTAISET